MTKLGTGPKSNRQKRRRRIVATLFSCWSIFVFFVLFNQFRTQVIDPSVFKNGPGIDVSTEGDYLQFRPKSPKKIGLVFFCGSGVEAEAYAPLLRPIADKGFFATIVKLPGRFAMLPGQKEKALDIASSIIKQNQEITRWVISGHSLGAALTCRFVQVHPEVCSGLVLVGTTHPKDDDLSGLMIPVTKIYGTEDGVAPKQKVEANRGLLPQSTKWVLIEGANHSQFGNYGHQLQDGKPSITREEQQAIVRENILSMLTRLELGTPAEPISESSRN